MIDSQSVKAPQAGTRGYDANKKIFGRKRHIAVDTDGRLLMVNLTTADISDSAGAQMILDAIRKRWPQGTRMVDSATRLPAVSVPEEAPRVSRPDGSTKTPRAGFVRRPPGRTCQHEDHR